MDGTYLTSGRAARHLGIAKGTLLRAVRRGEITPASRAPGDTFRFHVAEVEAYAQRLATAAPQPLTPPQPSGTPRAPTQPLSARGAPINPAPPPQGCEERYQALITALGQIVWITSAEGLVVDDVPLWRAYTGQSHVAVQGLGWLDAVHPEDHARTLQIWRHAVATGSLYEAEHRLRRADGIYRPFLARAAPVHDQSGSVREWVGVCSDLTDRYHSAADASALVETALDAVITINHVGRVVAFNPAAEHMFGYARGQVLGRDLAELIIPPDLRASHRAGLARYLATGADALLGRRVEVTAMRADGSLFPAEMAVTRVAVDGPPLFTGYVRDITERTRMEEALRHLALHDALTGLPNRTVLRDRLDQALAAARLERHPLALVLLDLDGFKEVNDALGHAAGDRLLQQIATRLPGSLRPVDTVARLGGDEFAVVLPGDDVTGALLTVQKLLAALEAPIEVEGQAVPCRASMGLALYPEHGDDAPTLLRRAEVAMYAAKQAHRPYAVYTPARDPYSPSRLDLIAALRQAIARGSLRLSYQPKLDVASGAVCGVEALVRWSHPEHGLIPPTQFIPLAEQTGLIAPLTRWVLGAALRQCGRWQRRGRPLAIAVNLSMWDVHDPELPAGIARGLRAAGVPPDALRVELTESAIMADADHALDVLTRLAALGVHLSVDDFGTGYSSLSYLKRLPVDEIKIDKSFVQQMATQSNDAAIVASTIGLGQGLGLRVVAEGVEDRETWDLLAGLGCDVAQGYYVSRPLPAPAFARWLQTAPDATRSGRGRAR